MEEARVCALERQKSEDVIDNAKKDTEGEQSKELKEIENELLTDEELNASSSEETAIVSNTEESSNEVGNNPSEVESMEI